MPSSVAARGAPAGADARRDKLDLRPEPVRLQPAHPARRAGREASTGRGGSPRCSGGAGRRRHHRGRRHDLQRADHATCRSRTTSSSSGSCRRPTSPTATSSSRSTTTPSCSGRSTTSGRRPEFAWEVAAIGINLVSMANNHALDFGPEGLADCLQGARPRQHHHAGAGLTLAAARAPGTDAGCRARRRSSRCSRTCATGPQKYRCTDPAGPCLATIDPAEILVAKPDGTVEAVEGPLRDRRQGDGGRRRPRQAAPRRRHGRRCTTTTAATTAPTASRTRRRPTTRSCTAGRSTPAPTWSSAAARTSCAASRSTRASRSSTASRTSSTSTGPRTRSRSTSSTSATARSTRPTNVSVWDRRDPRARSSRGSCVRMTVNAETARAGSSSSRSPSTTRGRSTACRAWPRRARGAEIIELMQRLSQPYGTTIVDKGWYAEVVLAP